MIGARVRRTEVSDAATASEGYRTNERVDMELAGTADQPVRIGLEPT